MIIIKKMHYTKVGKNTSLGYEITGFREEQIANKIKKILMRDYSIVSDIEVK